MAKSYRPRRARRRAVSVRLSWETYVLLLAIEGYAQDSPPEPSRRKQAAQRAIARCLAKQTRYDFVQCHLEYAGEHPEWSGEELMQYYSGVPELNYQDIFRYVSKNDPSDCDDFENQDLADN